MDSGNVAELALAQCKGLIASGAAKTPRLDTSTRSREQAASLPLSSADVLSDLQESELSELVVWAKKMQRAALTRDDRLSQVGVPVDHAKLRLLADLAGELIGAAEQRYQRAWHARAAGFVRRVG